MLKVRLLVLPFNWYHLPSLGCTQLESVLRETFGDRVDVKVLYLNHEIARRVGLEFYDEIRSNEASLNAALPEWLFRRAAHPHAEENAELYFRRYFQSSRTADFAERVRRLSERLPELLDSLVDEYQLADADVVGCSSMFFETNAAIAVYRRIKQKNASCVTLLGGASCESPSGEELARLVPEIDYVFSGSALKSLPALVGNLLNGRAGANDRIPGVFSKRNCGYKEVDGQKTRFTNVDSSPIQRHIDEYIDLDFTSFFESFDRLSTENDIKALVPFETSRGCWWGERSHCRFCGLNKSTMAYKSMKPELAIRLIQSLFKYRERASVFMCVDNILERGWSDEVLSKVDTPATNSIFYQVKANLKEQEIELMSRARVKSITPGFESLASSTLKLMAKGVDAFQNIKVMKFCRLHDVFPGWNLLIGSPGEKEDVYEKYMLDLPNLVHLPPPQAVYSIKFNRYSPYHDQQEHFGLKLAPVDHYGFVFPFPEDSLEQIAYDFQDTTPQPEYRLSAAKWIQPLRSRITAWRERWYERTGLTQPSLHVERDRNEVVDRRGPEETRHGIEPDQRQLLEFLQSCRQSAAIASELGGMSAERVRESLAFFDQHGWLFWEGPRVMALVLAREPPPMSMRDNGLGVVRRGAKRPVAAAQPIQRVKRPLRSAAR
jgi:magnesium-protoporphyrin IX monomethyl ester (oxidative) cyclase